MSLSTEIHEQPEVIQHLLDRQMKTVIEIAHEIHRHDIQYIFLVARGTSDNAGIYAKYLMGAFNHLPTVLATPSLFSMYHQPPQMRGALVLGISQSGMSPDIVSVLAEGRRQGCPTLAITNNPDSPLAKEAQWVIDIQAGKEQAVAATKTYVTTLMSIAMLSLALAEDQQKIDQLSQVPGWVSKTLTRNVDIANLAQRYRYMKDCVVLGRGYNYATAFEWALKLKEMAYVMAEPYSSADFMHGPIAVVERGFPVLAVAPDGAVFSNMLELLIQLKQNYRAELLVVSDKAEALGIADKSIMLPSGIPEWLTPLVSIVPAQLFSYYLTQVKGYDTESPRGLNKVTETW